MEKFKIEFEDMNFKRGDIIKINKDKIDDFIKYMEKYDNVPKYSFEYICNTYSFHDTHLIKSMVRRNVISSINSLHTCSIRDKICIYFENKILTENEALQYDIDSNEVYKESVLIIFKYSSLSSLPPRIDPAKYIFII